MVQSTTTVPLRDGNNNPISIRAGQYKDGSVGFFHSSAADVDLPDGASVGMIGTTMSKFSDGFSGPTLAAGQPTLDSLTKWTIVRNSGMTIQQLNGALVITTGVATGSEFLMIGNSPCTIPQNLITTMSVSTRSANQEIRTGYLEIDPATGQPIANPNLSGFFSNFCSLLLTGTVNTTAALETLSGNNPTTKVISVTGQTASTTTMEYSLEVRPEDVTYQQATADATSTKVSTGARISTMVPSPNSVYVPFFWARNTGAATSNTITIQRIVSMDIQELQVEVGGGRGNLAASQAIPVVQVASGTTQNVNANVNNATLSNASNSGATPIKINNAATNNLTLVKATAGRVWGGYIVNTGTAPVYLKLFNATSTGGVTMGTSAPTVNLPILAGSMINIASIVDQYGLYFSTGIVYAITSGALDLDNTALTAANTVVGALLYV